MNRITFLVERKLSTILLWGLTITAIFIVILKSNQSSFPHCEKIISKYPISDFSKGYNLVLDISIGFIISLIFYLIVVYIPNRQKQRDIKKIINPKCESVIYSSYSLINELIKNSNLNYNYRTLTKSQMAEICNSVNPLENKYKFAKRIDYIYESHFGYKIANDWKRIAKTIDEIFVYIPFIDTGLLDRLNAIREHFLKYLSNDLEISEKINISNLGAFSETFYDFYLYTKKLRDYYLMYSKNVFDNDPWK